MADAGGSAPLSFQALRPGANGSPGQLVPAIGVPPTPGGKAGGHRLEPLTRALVESGTTGIAYETVELPDGSLPLLTPMSEVAGRMAVQAAAQRNAAVRQGALDATRRLYACLAEAAQAAASSGTYRPDGSRHCAEDGVGTIRRQA